MSGVISLNPRSSSGSALMQTWIIDRGCVAVIIRVSDLNQLVIKMGNEGSMLTRLKGRVELGQRFLRSVMHRASQNISEAERCQA